MRNSFVTMFTSSHSATERAKTAKQETRESLIQAAESKFGLLKDHPEDQIIIRASAVEILENLRSKKDGWSAERVMIAYIRSACAAHRKTNCLTEILFEEALAQAIAKDAEYRTTGKAEGRFWGLPSSFKDTYNVVGVDSSIGCSIHCFDPTLRSEDEGGLVKLFRQEGGIVFCKTNVPQTLLSFECSNPVFGKSSNPYDPARTPGGSSGGEAALVSLGGSPIGWGSDVGGSLRIPAAYSGCYALKPVRGRFPIGGNRSTVKGFEGVRTVVGPMARSVGDLEYMARAMIDATVEAVENMKFADETLIPLRWREIELPKRLRVGYWTEDNLVKTSPACVRAVKETVDALRAAGHDVIEFTPPRVLDTIKIFAALSSAEGYSQMLAHVGPDPKETSMRLVTLGPSLPSWLHTLACWLIKNVIGDQTFADVFALSRYKTAGEYWYWTDQRNQFNKIFKQAAWEEGKFDILICPVQAVPALEHGRTSFLSPLAITTLLFNVIDSTVGALPITRVDKTRDTHPPDFLAFSPGSKLIENRVYAGDDPAYDAGKMHGLPVAIQVVGKEWEEEKVLQVMKIIEGLIRYE